jgi:glycogen synthase
LNLMRSGAMAQEFQWSRSAASYRSLYQKVSSVAC